MGNQCHDQRWYGFRPHGQQAYRYADWFQRQTTDPIFQFDVTAPGPRSGGRYWTNLPATIDNSGFEFALNYAIIRNANMTWNIGGNIAFLKNECVIEGNL